LGINYAEVILKPELDEHEGVKEAVNTLYQEVAERMNAERRCKSRARRLSNN
jgi:hypothetical protein